MRRNLLTSTALTTSCAFVTSAAMATDIPRGAVKAPVKAPGYSWSGCYGGLNAGIARSEIDQNLAIPAPVNLNFALGGRDTGFTGGVQAGCNWQFNPIIGIEGDFNYIRAKRAGNFAFVFSGEDTAGTMETKLRWFATLRGRFGVSLSPTMIYITGGGAFGDVKSIVNATVLGHVDKIY